MEPKQEARLGPHAHKMRKLNTSLLAPKTTRRHHAISRGGTSLGSGSGPGPKSWARKK